MYSFSEREGYKHVSTSFYTTDYDIVGRTVRLPCSTFGRVSLIDSSFYFSRVQGYYDDTTTSLVITPMDSDLSDIRLYYLENNEFGEIQHIIMKGGLRTLKTGKAKDVPETLVTWYKVLVQP